MPRYDFKSIESRWQQHWEENATFKAEDPACGKDKMYVLDMFPYPSGSGLHVGHPEGYTATDIVCRHARMNGKNVLHPMGWDSFGLPAEEHAVKTGTHPRETTEKNIATFKRQLKMLGFSYDWTRELATTDPEYYRWTQWIFLQLFDTWYDSGYVWTGQDGKQRTGKGRPISELPIPAEVTAAGEEAVRRHQDKHRLAYLSEAPVNWCPALGTVLANEEIIDGKSERGSHPVERVALKQWMLRITAYGDRLANELEELDWPESIKLLQRNWIGRSTGAEVDFYIGDASVGRAGSDRPSVGRAGSDRPSDQAGTNRPAGNGPTEFDDWKTTRSASGFPVEAGDDVLRVYTTRPDTLYGATYMVIAPEHRFVDRLTTDDQKAAVAEYCRKASMKSDLDRTELAKDKTGVFTGSYATNPVNGEQIPIWVADYVLISYGTGAIMAVPAHDDRDMEFAKTFELPIRAVVQPNADWLESHMPEVIRNVKPDLSWPEIKQFLMSQTPVTESQLEARRDELETIWNESITSLEYRAGIYANVYSSSPLVFGNTAFSGQGITINSGDCNGISTAEMKSRITTDLSNSGLGRSAVNYKLRDWLFSRQRYWGEPFPIWHELDADGNPTGLMRTESIESLPVPHPHMEDFKPTGTPEPMLAKATDEWLYKTDTDGVKLKRETNSMPQWAGSCWYFLRFCDNKNGQAFIDPALEKYWMPVDLYIGGAEHAVLHLLYSRFWHKVLFDRGHVSMVEPFQKLVNQGMILGEADENGKAEKMSKSRGNVINPDDVVKEYGADALRLYEMFMGPLEQVKPWSMKGVEGVYRFLGRVWRMIIDDRAEEVALLDSVNEAAATDEQLRMLHRTIKAVSEDIAKLSLNTAISRMMEFTNFMSHETSRPKSVLQDFVLLLSPFAPHIAEELWHALGNTSTLAYEAWPKFDEALLVEDSIEVPIQFNGKLKAKINVPNGLDAAGMQAAAEADENVQKQLEGKTIVKVIAVPGRMVNFVVR